MLNIGEFARLGQVSARMLRHYDETGLLRPERVDAGNGYRRYAVGQLGRLHRIVALRDLGFNVEQIRQALDENLSVDELRGMLRIRRAQIEQSMGAEHDRLRRVEAHLRSLERNATMDVQDVVIKHTQPLRIAEGVERGLSQPEVGAAIGRLVPAVLGHLASTGTRPGMTVAHYEDGLDDAGITAHAGFDIGDELVAETDSVHVVDLPVLEVASAVLRGPVTGIPGAWEALVHWIEDSGYELAGGCRELYLECHDEDSVLNVTELQQPISRR